MTNLIEKLRVYGDLLENTEFDVVTLHALADQTDLLRELELRPDQCTLCDAYWVFKDHMFFVGISCSSDKAPKVIYDRKANVEQGHRFNITLSTCPLTTHTVKVCLDYLSKWVKENNSKLIDSESPSPIEKIVVSNNDIAALG